METIKDFNDNKNNKVLNIIIKVLNINQGHPKLLNHRNNKQSNLMNKHHHHSNPSTMVQWIFIDYFVGKICIL